MSCVTILYLDRLGLMVYEIYKVLHMTIRESCRNDQARSRGFEGNDRWYGQLRGRVTNIRESFVVDKIARSFCF